MFIFFSFLFLFISLSFLYLFIVKVKILFDCNLMLMNFQKGIEMAFDDQQRVNLTTKKMWFFKKK